MNEAMTLDPNYKMPIENQLKRAQERADSYAEMFEIAQNNISVLKAIPSNGR